MKQIVTSPEHRTFFDTYAWMLKPLFYLGWLCQVVSFLTEFAPIKYAVEDSLTFFVGESVAAVVSSIAGVMAAIIIESFVRYGGTMTVRGVLQGHFSGKPIHNEKEEGEEETEQEAADAAKAGKLARVLAWLFVGVCLTGVGLSLIASFQGSKEIAKNYTPAATRDTLNHKADSAAILAAYQAFQADSLNIAAATEATERAAKRQAAATESPATAAGFRAEAAKAKAEGLRQINDRTAQYRAETAAAAGRIQAKEQAADAKLLATQKELDQKSEAQGTGLGWLTVFFMGLTIFSLIFVETVKHGSRQKHKTVVSEYAYHAPITSEILDAISARFNQVVREKVAAFDAKTKASKVIAPRNVIDATNVAASAKIVTPKPKEPEQAPPVLHIAAQAEQSETEEVQHRPIGYFQGTPPKSYAKGSPSGVVDLNAMTELKNKPQQQAGYYVIYPDQAVHSPDIPQGVYGTYPRKSPEPGALKQLSGTQCERCQVSFVKVTPWQKYCSESCRIGHNNATRGQRARN